MYTLTVSNNISVLYAVFLGWFYKCDISAVHNGTLQQLVLIDSLWREIRMQFVGDISHWDEKSFTL